MKELLPQILLAIVAGLFGLAPVIIEMVTNRARRGSSAQKLSSLFENLNFLEKWTNLSKEHQVGGQTEQDTAVSESIQSDLARILVKYQALKALEAEQQTRQFQELSIVRRMLLLFLPHSARGWLYHTLFYVLVIFSVTLIVSELMTTGHTELMDLIMGMLIVFGLPVILLVRKANQDRHRFIEQQQAKSDPTGE